MDWLSKLNQESGLVDIHLFDLAGTSVTVATLVVFLIIVVLTFLVSRLIQRAVAKAFKFRGISDAGTVEVSQRLLHYAVVATGLAIGLQTIGINLAAFLAAGAVFAIGLGFAMQNLAQNFVSGLILLIERSIKPGDVLEVEGRFVRVQRMAIRATIARTLDEEEIIVPNATIVQGTVKNFTLQDSLYRLRTTVGVSYTSDLDLVRSTLEEAASSVAWKARHRDPIVLLTGFGSSSVDYEISVFMEDPWRMRRATSDLNEKIWWALKKAGVTISFPQMDVHVDAPLIEALRRTG